MIDGLQHNMYGPKITGSIYHDELRKHYIQHRTLPAEAELCLSLGERGNEQIMIASTIDGFLDTGVTMKGTYHIHSISTPNHTV